MRPLSEPTSLFHIKALWMASWTPRPLQLRLTLYLFLFLPHLWQRSLQVKVQIGAGRWQTILRFPSQPELLLPLRVRVAKQPAVRAALPLQAASAGSLTSADNAFFPAEKDPQVVL